MNSSKLKETLELLTNKEAAFNIQNLLTELNNNLSNMANQPQQTQFQHSFIQARDNFANAFNTMRGQFSPAEMTHISEIGASPFFSDDLVGQIAAWVNENSATPIAAQQKVQTLLTQRGEYNSKTLQTLQGLNVLGVKVNQLKPGEVEIGFLIPRAMFQNELAPLIKELSIINRIIRAFSEATTGSAQAVEVHEISTTDPLFFFSFDPTTICAIGDAIKWALDTLKCVVDIRKAWADTESTKAASSEAVKDFFEPMIQNKVDLAIQEHTAKVLEQVPENGGRKNEQGTDIRWALESILARVDRGMTIEIRLIPPPPVAKVDGATPEVPREFGDLQKIVSELAFPPPSPTPVIKLPPPEPPMNEHPSPSQ